MQLRGSVAVVAGASSGIGEATALALAKAGAKVVLVARRLDRLEELAETIEQRGGVALAVKCDVTDPERVSALPSVVEEAFGPCDVLVNSAGVPGGGSLIDLSYEQIEKVVRVNLLGVMFGTRAFLPGMQARRRGHIVNVASLAGRFAPPGAAIYSATKHGVVAFSESLHYEALDHGVRITSVNPGLVSTEGFPQDHVPPRLVMKVERVADAIVKAVREGAGPEVSVPRWIAPLQAFRVITPPLYRWGVRSIRSAGFKSTQATKDRRRGEP